MNTLNIQTVKEAQDLITERGIDYVKVGVFDIDGIFRGKSMKASKFLHVLEKGFDFCCGRHFQFSLIGMLRLL